jgi:hypothetical protein
VPRARTHAPPARTGRAAHAGVARRRRNKPNAAMRGVALALAALALLAAGARGDIVKDRLDHDDRSIVLVARPFGFESNGVLDIKVENWKVYLEEGITGYDKTKLGFFITTAEAEAQLQQDLEAGARPLQAAAACRSVRAPSHVASAFF